jgi:hypothetical protein
MSDNIKELESNLVRDVSNMMMISFLEGSISTLTSLKKSYEMYGEIDATGSVPPLLLKAALTSSVANGAASPLRDNSPFLVSLNLVVPENEAVRIS